MKVIKKLVDTGASFGGWILLGTTVFITLDVILRYTVKVTFPAVYEITEEILMVCFIYLAMANASHVAVDFVVLRLRSSVRKKIEIFSLLLGSIFVLILFLGADYKAFTSFKFAEGTECELGYPLWPVRLVVAIGLGLLLLVQLKSLLKKIKRIKI